MLEEDQDEMDIDPGILEMFPGARERAGLEAIEMHLQTSVDCLMRAARTAEAEGQYELADATRRAMLTVRKAADRAWTLRAALRPSQGDQEQAPCDNGGT